MVISKLQKFSLRRQRVHSEKSVTIPELNHAPGVYKEHYVKYYVKNSSILLAGTGVWKISFIACGFSSIKTDYSDLLFEKFNQKNK